MSYLRSLHLLSTKDSLAVGGKAASLGELKKLGLNVPNGFVLDTSVFHEFLKQRNLETKISNLLKDCTNSTSIENISAKITSLIKETTFPLEIARELEINLKLYPEQKFAIRSSASAEDGKQFSFAGELETYLNTAKSNVQANIINCWASFFSERTLLYKFNNRILNDLNISVIVQKMLNPQISGVAFSINPVTNDSTELMIEAVVGLGESLVSGTSNPNNYTISKDTLKIKQSDIEIPDLNFPEQLYTELCQTIKRIEKHYNQPIDIEWAIQDNKLFILQARPITTTF